MSVTFIECYAPPGSVVLFVLAISCAAGSHALERQEAPDDLPRQAQVIRARDVDRPADNLPVKPAEVQGKGELGWPAVQRLSGVSGARYRLLNRDGTVGVYALDLLLPDGSYVAVEDASELLRFVDRKMLLRDRNSALAVASIAVGIRDLSRAVEDEPVHRRHIQNDPGRFEVPFYGCAQLSAQGIHDLERDVLRLRLNVSVAPTVQQSNDDIRITFPCVYWDLEKSIWLQDVTIGPSRIVVRAERAGLRLEDGRGVPDDGRYTSR